MEPDPIAVSNEGRAQVAGLLLAAGQGRRYGAPKALVEHNGRLLVEHALRTLRTGGCAPLLVVLGAAADQVRASADLTGARVLINGDWPSGMASSLHTGLAAAATTGTDAVLVLLVDTPGVTAAAVARIAARAAPDGLAAATYQGQRAHPVLLGRRHWDGVLHMASGDVGARPYLARHRVEEVPCDDIADGADIDHR